MPAQISWLLFQGLLPLTGAGVIYLLWGFFRYVTSASKAKVDYHWSAAADPLGWLYGSVILAAQSALQSFSLRGNQALAWGCLCVGLFSLLLLVSAMTDRGEASGWKPPSEVALGGDSRCWSYIVFRILRTHSDLWTNTMIENKGSNMKPDDALEDTFDFQETVEFLMTSRPDLEDPERLRLFETALHQQLAMQDPTPESARAARARYARAVAERRRARKFMEFSMTVSGGGLAAILTAIIAPGAPLPVIVGMGLLGLLAAKHGLPKLDRWERRRRDQRRRFPV